MRRLVFLAVLLLSASAGGCFGDASEDEPDAVASPTSIIVPSPEPLTPSPAHDLGRDDCPADWMAYEDPGRFSICFPNDWTAITAPGGPDLGTTLELHGSGRAAVVLYWRSESYFSRPEIQDLCKIASLRDAQPVTVEIAQMTAVACTGIVYPSDETLPELRGTFGEIEAADGFVTVVLTEPDKTGSHSTLSSIHSAWKKGRSEAA